MTLELLRHIFPCDDVMVHSHKPMFTKLIVSIPCVIGLSIDKENYSRLSSLYSVYCNDCYARRVLDISEQFLTGATTCLRSKLASTTATILGLRPSRISASAHSS